LFLQTHYRQEANFTWVALAAAQTALKSLREQIGVIRQQMQQGERSSLSDEKLDKVNFLRKRFKDVIRLDLNTAQGLAVVWEVIKSNIPPGDKYDIVMICDEILGLGLVGVTGEEARAPDVPAEVAELLSVREKFRKQQEFAKADSVRKQIEDLGFILEDLPTGPRVKKNGT
ncbi:MAG: hypothetical protein AAB874_02885, partial [Patescibacteria group bacterium]